MTQGLFGILDDHGLCLPEARTLFCVYATPGDIQIRSDQSLSRVRLFVTQ